MDIFEVVIDTNVIFSALYSTKGASYTLVSLLEKNLFKVHLSVPLVLEYEEKLKEHRKTLGLSNEEIDGFIDYLCSISVCHDKIDVFWRPCLSDPDDEMVLELGIHSGADFIITHNIKDFRRFKGFDIRAITPGDFVKKLRDGGIVS